MAVVLKTTVPGRVPGVRIPLPPPHSPFQRVAWRVNPSARGVNRIIRPCAARQVWCGDSRVGRSGRCVLSWRHTRSRPDRSAHRGHGEIGGQRTTPTRHERDFPAGRRPRVGSGQLHRLPRLCANRADAANERRMDDRQTIDGPEGERPQRRADPQPGSRTSKGTSTTQNLPRSCRPDSWSGSLVNAKLARHRASREGSVTRERSVAAPRRSGRHAVLFALCGSDSIS